MLVISTVLKLPMGCGDTGSSSKEGALSENMSEMEEKLWWREDKRKQTRGTSANN